MKIKVLYLIAGIIFAAGIAGCILALSAPKTGIVRISQNGMVVREIDVSKAEDQFIEMEFEGRKNLIEIKNGEIRVFHADCPDKVCVNMGRLRSGIPIVCLPNRLVIEFAENEFDAAVN